MHTSSSLHAAVILRGGDESWWVGGWAGGRAGELVCGRDDSIVWGFVWWGLLAVHGARWLKLPSSIVATAVTIN
jgi:hypothetical protein